MAKKEDLPIIRGLLMDLIDYKKLIEMQSLANERLYNPKIDGKQNKRSNYDNGLNNEYQRKH